MDLKKFQQVALYSKATLRNFCW